MHDHAQSIIRRHIEDARQAAKLDADDPVRAEGHHIYAVLLELIADEIAAALDSRAGDAGEGLTIAQRAARIKNNAYGVWWNGLTDHQRRIASIDNAFLAGVTAALSATPAPAVDAGKDHNGGRCPDCDDTGDVHRIDGEWLGTCHCPASTFSNPTTFGTPTFGVGTAVDAVPAGEVERFVIRRNGAFFRPNAQGYTTHIVAAGFYTREEADSYASVEGVTIEPLERYRAEAERTIAEANRLLASLSHGEGRK